MNLILATDSYKLTHWEQYPENTEYVYSYLESREGATFSYTVFFGLQAILMEYFTKQITLQDINEAEKLAMAHFGKPLFNRAGWEYILREHYGYLPLEIKAVPEGLPIPTGNVLMTVVNTDPKCWWLTNVMESILTHVWYPSTVATLSRVTKELMRFNLDKTSDNPSGLPFMLHDFGYRGASSHDSAGIGGAGHLVNFMGTDTLPAMLYATKYYDADLESLAFSVPATEHSVMTADGPQGEYAQMARVMRQNPTGIISVVADSFNIYRFTENVCDVFKPQILSRNGVFVLRPDSTTIEHQTPAQLVVWILDKLWAAYGGEVNSKEFKVLDPHIRVLWGDGIDTAGIGRILDAAKLAGFSAENMVFGMGGGLLQKINRDTQRFAFKCSAQYRFDRWFDVYKDPIDSTKVSKRGRLMLVKDPDDVLGYVTQPFGTKPTTEDILQTVYRHGDMQKTYTFAEVRNNAILD